MLTSCEADSLEPTIIDSPPEINIKGPGPFILEGFDFDIEIEFKDGAFEETSISPLASASFEILDADTVDVLVPATNLTVSGIKTDIDVPFNGGNNNLARGSYVIRATASDTQGNETVALKRFTVIQDFASISIIGSATPGGWGNDTNMTRDTANPVLWKINDLVLINGEAKFRANGAWSINWGATGFPTGTGTQDGPNIPIAAGTYDIQINVLTGEYRFQ